MAQGFKTGGRQKGTPNRVSGQLREMVLAALDEHGGIEYLKAQAIENPVAFMGLLGKILPTQITGDPENPVEMVHRVERLIVDPANQNP